MNLSEFARDRGVEPQAVSRYINRHKKEYEGHIKINGNAKEIDDVALKLLEKQYPLPSPIQVIQDTESREKLVQSQEMVIQLQQQVMKMQIELSRQQFIEEKKEMLEADLNKKEQELVTRNKENECLKLELQAEKAKSWFDKLRGK